MKPADRALDLVVVGLGQGGGNLAAEFARLGYRAMALNTAHTDLSTLAPGQRGTALAAEQRIYIGIDGYDGAGADLNYGRECITENAERIRQSVLAHAQGADVVILTAGLGGGTGSAVSELVRVLQDLDLPLITLTTLPNEYESGIAKVNAVRAVSDLVKTEGVGWIFADNSRLAQVHGGVSLDKYFEKVNEVIVGPIDAFNKLNNRQGIHPIRTLDGEDFRSLLLSGGVLHMASSTLPMLTVDMVMERIREALSSSSVMPSGFSPEEISYMGVVLEAGEDVLSGTPFSFFEQLNERLKDDTGGGALYMGVYRRDRPVEGGAALLRTICSSKSLPEGVQAMVNDARREGGTLRDKLQRSISSLELGEIEEFDLFKTSTRTQGHTPRRRVTAPPLNVPEIDMARGARGKEPAPRVTPSRAPKAETSAEPDPEPGAATSVAPTTSVRPRPSAVPFARPGTASATGSVAAAQVAAVPAPQVAAPAALEAPAPAVAVEAEGAEASSPAGTAPLSEPPDATAQDDSDRRSEAASYAKLVATFLRTEFESTKKRVARRLDAARKSDDAKTRGFAERAIERIRSEGQGDAFEAALAGEESPDEASSSA
jgi:cell division GTPase FtsZ